MLCLHVLKGSYTVSYYLNRTTLLLGNLYWVQPREENLPQQTYVLVTTQTVPEEDMFIQVENEQRIR